MATEQELNLTPPDTSQLRFMSDVTPVPPKTDRQKRISEIRREARKSFFANRDEDILLDVEEEIRNLK